MFLTLIPTNAFLIAYTLFVGFEDPFFFTMIAVTISFIEMMKGLVIATAMQKALYEFALSLALLLGSALYVQATDQWDFNYITVCVYLQLLDTLGGFAGTFLRNRRSNR